MQQRLEASRTGRILLSLAVVVVVAGVAVWNLPPSSELARRAQPKLHGVVYAAGLDQSWAVFAPDPPRQELVLEARIVYDDGTQRTWEVPTGGPLIGAYWDYRWLKWAEWMSGGSDARLWQPAAAFIAREEQDAGRRPVSVTLVRQVYQLPLGGPKGEPSPVNFYTYAVPADREVPPA